MANLTRIQQVERRVVKAVIEAALAAGYEVRAGAGAPACCDKKTVLKQMFTSDDEYLELWQVAWDVDQVTKNPVNGRREKFGWVRFIYGGDGHNVIAEYSDGLEELLEPVKAMSISDRTWDLPCQTAEQITEDLSEKLGVSLSEAAALLLRAQEKLDQEYVDEEALELAKKLHSNLC